jgi:hypothetical protein
MSVPAWRYAERRFAPYIESRHADLLNTTAAYRASIVADSPYSDYIDQNFDEAFFGAGYAIADFPSLYDMFGKYMAGFDIESMWSRSFDTATTLDGLDARTKKLIVDKDEELTRETIPEYKLRMRELGAVTSSSFVIGKAQIESQRTKVLSVISADTKLGILAEAENKFTEELNWNQSVVTRYAALMKFYYMTATTGTDAHYTFAARNTLWSMEVLDFERSVLSAMRPGVGFSKMTLTRRRSNLSKILSVTADTVTGAMIGAQIGSWQGAIVGAAIGTHVGIAKMLLEENRYDLLPLSFILPAPFYLMFQD